MTEYRQQYLTAREVSQKYLEYPKTFLKLQTENIANAWNARLGYLTIFNNQLFINTRWQKILFMQL